MTILVSEKWGGGELAHEVWGGGMDIDATFHMCGIRRDLYELNIISLHKKCVIQIHKIAPVQVNRGTKSKKKPSEPPNKI